jgi:hypothetical protein
VGAWKDPAQLKREGDERAAAKKAEAAAPAAKVEEPVTEPDAADEEAEKDAEYSKRVSGHGELTEADKELASA